MLNIAVLLAGEGTELVVSAFQAVTAVEQSLGGAVATHHSAVFVEDRRAHHQPVDGRGIELPFGVQLLYR
ncbi:hypothetical protein D3C75_1088010 [compost metagenome]